MSRNSSSLAVPQVALLALFVTALITAQVTAAKVLAFDLPVSIPVAGDTLLLPGAALAYALTFFASDCYAELYGRRAAQVMVNVAFAMNFVLLALVWSTIAAPISGASSVSQAQFADVLGASTGIVVGSLAAYVVSQNWDVIVFHRIRDATDGEHLWLRNLGSTATSQLIDTVIFVGIAFFVFQGLPLEAVVSLIVGQYLLKLGIAALDTPFVYLVVGLVRSREQDSTALAFGD
ncbi:queuosine precursor transporter [Halapricum hydrolyticum]|uniref:Probable queuosine precursor transporter n=1 Tax=Halapricum hydrolyticum TaxID=2979991 RepID=A0AAE3LJZ8_9EURY|nr:queuosine precursor transporter [Halapricum hydrolyticum]MCU4718844.1 queuosine precursor transporter [Halapricum hydrolyticum]MCU4727878.1 queuosine precursor transporter [Halapricum hydrolyticum]